MSRISRRHFLQFAGSTLATLGLSQFDLAHRGDRLRQAFAQSTGRKFALLIGINNYEAAGISSLRGCLTDVSLQRYLLMHRFGFPEENIISVWDNAETSDRKPTRANILSAFETLIQEVQPGDTVVIHYSGHGSRVQDPRPISIAACGAAGESGFNGTLVPNDAAAVLRTDTEIVVPDIMGRTLFLLTKAFKTENVTLILDSCHAGAGTRGNSLVRAAGSRSPDNQILVPSEEEIEYQARWLKELNWAEDDFQRERQTGVARGVAIGSALCDQLAIDALIDVDLYAGGFTYLLTRYLWQQPTSQATETVYSTLIRSTRSFAETKRHTTEQVPLFEFAPGKGYERSPIYFTTVTTPPAEAVITNKDALEFWLGGISSQALRTSAPGSTFSILDAEGQTIGELEQTSRTGFMGYGRLISGDIDQLQNGQLLREKVVGLPGELTLKVGVDPSLGEQRTQAETELATVSRVDVVSVSDAMDVLLARFTEDDAQLLQQSGTTTIPPVGSVGLFTADRTLFDANTFGPVDEPVIAAINRLRPRFKRMLADQVLGVLLTGSGSSLQVRAEIAARTGSDTTIPVATRSVREAENLSVPATPPQFRSGTELQITVENLDARRDLYLSVLVIGADGVMNVLYPAEWDAPEEAARIDRQGSLVLPRPEEGRFTVQGTSGFPEILILTSTEPLRNALKGMQAIAGSRGMTRGPIANIDGDESLSVVDALLGDLTDLSTRSSNGTVGLEPAEARSLTYDTSTLAVLSAVIEVIP